MRVAVSGSRGLVGSAVVDCLEAAGHTAVPLVRRQANEGEIAWDPVAGTIDSAALEGIDAVIHLAAESIAGRRWNAAFKKKLVDSRVDGTRLLAETLANLSEKPKAFICASAIGFYGDRGDEICTEETTAGDGFLADLCQRWEEQGSAAAEAGIRVVFMRIAMVLSSIDGALKKMLLPFKLGVGGKVGSGSQHWSWIHRTDLAKAILFCLDHDEISGPVNATAPEPVTNLQFTKALGTSLKRPTIFPMPAFAAKLALGEMANDLLLGSCRVVPNRLSEAGFQFEFSQVNDALDDILVRKSGA